MAGLRVTTKETVKAGPEVDRPVVIRDFDAVFRPPAAPVPVSATLTGGSFPEARAGACDVGIYLDRALSGIEHVTFVDRTGQGDTIRAGRRGDDLPRGGADTDIVDIAAALPGGRDRIRECDDGADLIRHSGGVLA